MPSSRPTISKLDRKHKTTSEATLIILCHAFAKNIDCTRLFLQKGRF